MTDDSVPGRLTLIVGGKRLTSQGVFRNFSPGFADLRDAIANGDRVAYENGQWTRSARLTPGWALRRASHALRAKARRRARAVREDGRAEQVFTFTFGGGPTSWEEPTS